MSKKISIFIGGLILLGLLHGCATIEKTMAPAPEEAIVIELPPRQSADFEVVPAHIKFVISAIINKLRGDRDSIEEVVFDPSGTHMIADDESTYDDFYVSLTEITGFEMLEEQEQYARLLIEGVLHFRDNLGRGSSSYFAAEYSVAPEKMTIHKSGTVLIPPTIPDLEAFFVPQASFEEVTSSDEMRIYPDLYLHALTNSFTMLPTDEERKEWEAYQEMSFWNKVKAGMDNQPDNYYILVFCKDRLPPESLLEMSVTSKPNRMGGKLADAMYLDDNGWRVMIAGGNFYPDTRSSQFYVSVSYNTDPEAKNKSMIIASYTNQKNFSPPPPPGETRQIISPEVQELAPPVEETQEMASPEEQEKVAPEPNRGPIESGELFLNPENKDEAKLIQERLKFFGYYKSAIDGLFGPGSRNALKEYAQSIGLDSGTTWTLEVQMALFEGTGM